MPRRELRSPEFEVAIFADEVMATFTIPYSKFGPVDILLTEDEAFRLSAALSDKAAYLIGNAEHEDRDAA